MTARRQLHLRPRWRPRTALFARGPASRPAPATEADITLTGRRHAARHARRPLRSPFATAPRSPVCRSLRYAYALAGLPRRDGSALALALCRYITMPAQAVRRAPHHLNPVPACHSAHALGCYTLQREIAPARVCESGRGRVGLICLGTCTIFFCSS